MEDIERVAMRLADDYADEFVSLAGRIAITQALRNVREAALDEAAAAIKALARKHADKIIGEDTEEAEMHRKSEAWMMLQCQHDILALKSAGNPVGAVGNTQNTMGISEKTK